MNGIILGEKNWQTIIQYYLYSHLIILHLKKF